MMKPNNIHSFVLIAGLATTSNVLANEFPASGDFAKGAQVWADNCGRCHNIRGPQDMRNDQWITTMFHMRVRAGLTGQETRDVLTFLQTSNSPATVTSNAAPTISDEDSEFNASTPDEASPAIVKDTAVIKSRATTQTSKSITNRKATKQLKPDSVRTKVTRPAPVKPTRKIARAPSSTSRSKSTAFSPTELALANKLTTKKTVAIKARTKPKTVKNKTKSKELQSPKAVSRIKTVVSKSSTKSGKAIYTKTCIACHGSDGTGALPGVPDFTKKGGRLTKSDSTLVTNMINGFQSPGSPMAMPAKGGNPKLTKSDIKAVLVYIRSAFSK